MKLLDRYEFTNGKAFETYYLDANDTYLNDVPESDVIGFLRVSDKPAPMMVMRPDEALIQARMLIDAVNKVTSGYEIELKQSAGPEDLLENLFPKWRCPKCNDWFHLPYKFCSCPRDNREVDHATTEESQRCQ